MWQPTFALIAVVVVAGHIDHADAQKRKKIESWIASVNSIHKEKPPAAVSYLRRMPDIEALMQVCCKCSILVVMSACINQAQCKLVTGLPRCVHVHLVKLRMFSLSLQPATIVQAL